MPPEIAAAAAAEPVAPMSLAEHIALEEATPAEIPVDEPAKAPVAAEPAKVEEPKAEDAAAEADSTKPDADLSEAGRTLRKNRADERKAKIQREIDTLKREEFETRDRVAALKREHEDLSRGKPAVSPTAGGVTPAVDPSDPEPTLESFVAANPNHPDPYAGAIEARVRWAIRQENKAADATRQRQQADQGMATALGTFEERAKPVREAHSDFDAVIADLVLTPPMQQAVLGVEHGPQLAYHLAKHPALHREIANLPPAAALFRLGQVAAQITAPAKAEPPLVTKAPAPPSLTLSGSAAAAEPDTRKGVPLADHIRIEEAEIAERRKRGHRY